MVTASPLRSLTAAPALVHRSAVRSLPILLPRVAILFVAVLLVAPACVNPRALPGTASARGDAGPVGDSRASDGRQTDGPTVPVEGQPDGGNGETCPTGTHRCAGVCLSDTSAQSCAVACEP